MINSLEDQLTRDEGCKSYAYQDSRGYWTVGIGTCVDQRVGCGLTNDEIDLLFNNRVALAKKALAEAFPWTQALDQVRLEVLENMTFEMGVSGLAGFRNMLTAIQQGNWIAAAAAMLDSDWAREQSPARAQRLSVQIQTDTRQ